MAAVRWEVRSPRRAAEYKLLACERGTATWCSEMAQPFLAGDEKAQARGVVLLTRGCKGNDVKSCAALGKRFLLLDGRAESAEVCGTLAAHAGADDEARSLAVTFASQGCKRLRGILSLLTRVDRTTCSDTAKCEAASAMPSSSVPD